MHHKINLQFARKSISLCISGVDGEVTGSPKTLFSVEMVAAAPAVLHCNIVFSW